MSFLLCAAPLQGAWAQGSSGYYAGLETGVPFGISTFSSFGADKLRAGYAFGLFGGYRFSPVLSAELTLKGGRTSLSARECCAASDYWLGANGVTYHSAAPGVSGYDYSELKSDVSLQQYGVRLNVNLLGLFAATRQSRWTLEVSPALTAVGTKATVKPIAENNNLMQDKTRWHLGAGGNLQAGYRLTEHLKVGIYSGITWLTGKGLDGIKEHVHDANWIWESGVRLGWAFGKSGRKAKKVVPDVSAVTPESVREVCPEKPESPAITITDIPEIPDIQPRTDSLSVLSFPTVYFGFNRMDIAAGEKAKLQVIRDTLRAYPDVQVLVTGWCDNVGRPSVNDRISRGRAESVKTWLVNNGIEAGRIRTQGMGIDYDEADRSKARRADINEKREM